MHPVRLFAAVLTALILGALVPGAPAARADFLDPPALGSPADRDVVKANPTFTWSAVPRASRYRIQVSTTAAFSSTVYTAEVVGTSATPVTELPLGSLHWRVASIHGARDLGPYSAARTVTRTQHDAPQLVAPANGVTLSYPAEPAVLSWRPVAGMESYAVQIDDEPTFTGAVSQITAGTSFALATPLPFGSPRYWRVQGISTDPDVTTEWSDARQLRDFKLAWPATTKPELLGPADSLTVARDDHEFSWTPVPGAAKYEIQISNVESFTTFTSQVTGATRYTPPTVMAQDQYFWRVRALQSNGSATSWSSVWRTKREWLDAEGAPARPVLQLRDADQVALGTQLDQDRVSVSWSAVRQASYYELEISTDPAFLSDDVMVRRRCKTPNTEWTPYISGVYTGTSTDGFGACAWTGTPTSTPRTRFIEPGATYYVRVRAVDETPKGETRTTLWSNSAREGEASPPATASFTVKSPARTGTDASQPAVLDPVPDATGTPKLSWRPVQGAQAYLVALARDSSFNTRVFGGDGYVVTANTELVLNHALRDNSVGQPYFWYVLPCARWDSATGNSCPVGANQAINIPGKHASFFKLGKAVEGLTSAPVQTDTVSLKWQDQLKTSPQGGGTSWYELEVRNAAGTVVDSVKTDALGYSPIDESYAEGQYTWRVRAVDGGGASLDWSSPASFKKQSGAPELRQPEDAGGSPVLRWTPTAFAASYDVEIYRGVDETFPAGNKVAAATGNSGRRYAEWVPTTALAPETYSWRVRQVDAYGNPGAWSTRILPFTIGATKPDLLSPADGSRVPAPALMFGWTPVAGAVRYLVESSATPGFGTLVESVRTVGTRYAPAATYAGGVVHHWRVSALNAANERLATTAPATFVPMTAPATPTASARLLGAQIQVSWPKPDDGGSGLTGHVVRYRPSGTTAWTELLTAGDVTSAVFGGLAPNQKYEAQVAASNAVGVGAFSSTVSATTPLVPGPPTALAVTPGTRGFTATWKAPSTGAAALPITGYVVRATPIAGGTPSEMDVAATSAALRDLADSTGYSIDVAARNAIGRGPFTSAQATTLPPPPPPDTAITLGPADGSTIGTRTATFSFSGTPAAFLSSYECQVDGGGFTPCASPLVLTDLAEGSHSLRVRARDNAGDADQTPAERRFAVDVSAPDTAITSGPGDGTASSASFTYSGSPGPEIARFECKLDSGSFATCPATGTSYSWLAPGAHSFTVRAVDAASNADPSPATWTWTVHAPRGVAPSSTPFPTGTSGAGPTSPPSSGPPRSDRQKLVDGLARIPGSAAIGKNAKSLVVKLPAGALPAGTTVRLKLTSVPPSPRAKPAAMGSGSATVRAGTPTRITIKLTAQARAALKRNRRLKTRMTGTATAANGTTASRTATLTLRVK